MQGAWSLLAQPCIMRHLSTSMYDSGVQSSLDYLASGRACDSLARDAYWPKWDSPWWHMLLLHEMGLGRSIPERAVQAMVAALERSPVKTFPIPPALATPECHCHCALGSIYQVLAGWGVEVERELPWIRPWFLRYQMADGGLNCDETAYKVDDECPSSMVGTLAVFEAVLNYTPGPYTDEELDFLDRGAHFLVGRQLRKGSCTRHNSEERDSEARWLQPCFPRFYFYDVLRGLDALVHWAQRCAGEFPWESVQAVVEHLLAEFPDGTVKPQRYAFEGVSTYARANDGASVPEDASFFPLLSQVSVLGQPSPFLTRQWTDVRTRLGRLYGDAISK